MQNFFQKMNPENLVRKNVAKFKSYSSARSEFSAIEKMILLDANESPFGDGKVNFYPDPLQKNLRAKFAKLKNFPENQIVFGNGSDELLDLLVRIFCEPQKDSLAFCPPTFGMYAVVADLNEIAKIEIPLDENFQIRENEILQTAENAKIIFICSPNNPTANLISAEKIFKILKNFRGIVAIDEAYVEFSNFESWISQIENFENLVVFQT